MSGADDQRVFVCPAHEFVIVVRGDEMSSRGSPGRRATGCETCDRIVDEAITATRFVEPPSQLPGLDR